MYTNFISHNLKLMTMIDNIQQYLDSIQSNVNFEPSFAAIHEVLREIWLFEHKF